MKIILMIFFFLVLISLFQAQIIQTNTYKPKDVKKGLTMQVTHWPNAVNNWVGRFSCNKCNPYEGDQFCNKSLPLVCIKNAKMLPRPYYEIFAPLTPHGNNDGGIYDGWTGGLFIVSRAVLGSTILNYNTGDNICKQQFGNLAQWAKFNDGYYMPFMNERPIKAWNLWNWNQAKQGGWNLWGYINHKHKGRAWVWIDNYPHANCAR